MCHPFYVHYIEHFFGSHDQYRTLLESHDEYRIPFESHDRAHKKQVYSTSLLYVLGWHPRRLRRCMRLGWRCKAATFSSFWWQFEHKWPSRVSFSSLDSPSRHESTHAKSIYMYQLKQEGTAVYELMVLEIRSQLTIQHSANAPCCIAISTAPLIPLVHVQYSPPLKKYVFVIIIPVKFVLILLLTLFIFVGWLLCEAASQRGWMLCGSGRLFWEKWWKSWSQWCVVEYFRVRRKSHYYFKIYVAIYSSLPRKAGGKKKSHQPFNISQYILANWERIKSSWR